MTSVPTGLSAKSRGYLQKLARGKDLPLEESLSNAECYAFWDSEDVLQWLSEHGYTLYKRVLEPEDLQVFTVPAMPYESFQQANYPYAYHYACPIDDGEHPMLTAVNHNGRIAYAQDRQGRHVVIKLTQTDSEEYRILKFLHEQDHASLRDNCVLPVLDLLHFEGACFVVMPRWGRNITEPAKFQTLRDVLRMIRSMLKSLYFIHSHHIVHRDLSFANHLINHFGPEQMVLFDNNIAPGKSCRRPNNYWPSRQEQLSQGLLEYALIDFDLAIMFPSDINPKEYMRPAEESYVGTFFPDDTALGEFQYNPFMNDVGILGSLLRGHYRCYAKHIPLLAPFFDRLATRNTRARFTAQEALCFVEKIITSSTDVQLSAIAPPQPDWDGDMWAGLPEEFQQEWASYRAPVGTTWTARVIRTFFRIPFIPGFAIVRNLRWLFSKTGRLWSRILAFLIRRRRALSSTDQLHRSENIAGVDH